jgi:hypothetical protein
VIELVQVVRSCKDCRELTGLAEEVFLSQEGLSAVDLHSLKSYNC